MLARLRIKIFVIQKSRGLWIAAELAVSRRFLRGVAVVAEQLIASLMVGQRDGAVLAGDDRVAGATL